MNALKFGTDISKSLETFRNAVSNTANEVLKELTDELTNAKAEGISQGWEECRDVQKNILPSTLEYLINSSKGLVDTSFPEKVLNEYKESRKTVKLYSEEEIKQLMAYSFNHGKNYNEGYNNPEHFARILTYSIDQHGFESVITNSPTNQPRDVADIGDIETPRGFWYLLKIKKPTKNEFFRRLGFIWYMLLFGLYSGFITESIIKKQWGALVFESIVTVFWGWVLFDMHRRSLREYEKTLKNP